MAGVTTAWRLSEPGWERPVSSRSRSTNVGTDSVERAPVSRGVHGRIEEHGLHIWLGLLRQRVPAAARVLRASSTGRPPTPGAPIRTWRDAMLPSDDGGTRGPPPRRSGVTGSARFCSNDLDPGDPTGDEPVPLTELTPRGSAAHRSTSSTRCRPSATTPASCSSARPAAPTFGDPVVKGLPRLAHRRRCSTRSAARRTAGRTPTRPSAALDRSLGLLRRLARRPRWRPIPTCVGCGTSSR